MSPTRTSSFKFGLLFFLQLVLATQPTILGEDTSEMSYQIKTTWDGLPLDHDPVSVKLVGKGEEGVEIQVEAPFFGIPGNPGGTPGEPFDKLWEYEVVEVFFADGNVDKPKYLEVELSPWGQHLVLLLDGVQNAVRTLLPLKFESTIESGRWHGKALVPSSYFPPGVTRFNAYAIHDVDHSIPGDPRRYESLFPTPNGKYQSANFHRLEYFQPLQFETLQPGNSNAHLSDPWPQDKTISGEKDSELLPRKIVTMNVQADHYLMGGSPFPNSTSSMIVEGISDDVSAHILFTANGFLHNGSDPLDESSQEPLPDKDLDRYETLRVYIANEERKLVELIFSPSGRYDVRLYREPYIRISRGHRLTDVKISKDEVAETWTVEAQVPLSYIPASVSRIGLAAVYGGVNGTSSIYETTYSVTNAGICIVDLFVIKLFPQVKEALLLPILNEAYSDLWGMEGL